MIRVLDADDQILAREGLAMILAAQDDMVADSLPGAGFTNFFRPSLLRPGCQPCYMKSTAHAIDHPVCGPDRSITRRQ